MEFSNPEAVVANIEVAKGAKVADFGTGGGAYAFALARRVGPDGKVYALDVQKDLLERVKSEAREMGIRNIETLWCNLDEIGGSKLGASSLDLAVAANVLFQSEHKPNFVKELKRVVKRGGHVLLVDWSGSTGAIGPRPDHVVTEPKAKELFASVGFTFVRSFIAGAHHYGLVFTA